jgi:hypothetical protein
VYLPPLLRVWGWGGGYLVSLFCGRKKNVAVPTSVPGSSLPLPRHLGHLRSRFALVPCLSAVKLSLGTSGKCELWSHHLTALVFLEGIQIGQEKTVSLPWGLSWKVKLPVQLKVALVWGCSA